MDEVTAEAPPGVVIHSSITRWIGSHIWWLAVLWLAAIFLGAVIIPFTPADPEAFDYSAVSQSPSLQHPLGTDQLGRDMLVRVLFGARTSFLIGISSVIIGMTVGLVLGLIGGYYSGIVRSLVGLVTDTLLAFPVLVLVSALVAIRGATVESLVVGLSIGMLPTFVRLSRANTMTHAQRDFVTTARVMGARTPRILIREILPNVLPPVLAYSLIVLGVAIVAEGSLSFLGLGVPPPTPTWGSMIAQGRQVYAQSPLVVFTPALVLLLTILSLNIAGERLSGGRQVRLHVPI